MNRLRALEVEQLRAMSARGLAPSYCASLLGYRERTIRIAMQEHGIETAPKPSERWTPERDEWLRRHMEAGGTISAAAAHFQVSQFCASTRCKLLGLTHKHRARPNVWTPVQDAVLAEVFQSGQPWSVAAKRLNRETGACYRRGYTIGLRRKSGIQAGAPTVEMLPRRERERHALHAVFGETLPPMYAARLASGYYDAELQR